MAFLPICTSKLHHNNMNRIKRNITKSDFVANVFKTSIYTCFNSLLAKCVIQDIPKYP